MMKRSKSEGDSSQEDAEMDVDDEEKAERGGDDDEAENEEHASEGEEQVQPTEGRNPFLDSFYGLSSSNARDRAQAAQVLLDHCLVGPEANAKDASYAFRRLLYGLCSGRAAARQGNASALASFLRIAFQKKVIQEIKVESMKDEPEELSDLAFVRKRLLSATEPGETQGQRKRSEERDHQFGRLFGVTGAVRSGILLPHGENAPEMDDAVAATSGFVRDLAQLYKSKKWMREPAAHAVVTLLNSFYALCPGNADAQKMVDHLVENVVVPEFLANGDNQEESGPVISQYSAEQLAIAISIQSQVNLHSVELPSPINKSILTEETIPLVASALSETSVVAQPRTHLVWDSIWCFITESDDTSNSPTEVDMRKVREHCPIGGERVDELLGFLLEYVVVERLLGFERSDKQEKGSAGKTTHERRSLALCIIRNLAGVEFMSSIKGRTRISLSPQVLESTVLRPLLVRRLFRDVICAGTGGSNKQTAHMLKPLAVQVLQSILEATVKMEDADASAMGQNRRIAVARAFLRCDPRFDPRTKTVTVERLLYLDANGPPEVWPTFLWTEYILFLESQIASSEVNSEEEAPVKASYEALGYVDLLFNMGKRLIKYTAEEDSPFSPYRASTTKRIIGFLMIVAFFDCAPLVVEGETKNHKGKKKRRKSSAKLDPVLEIAAQIHSARPEGTTIFPYAVRSAASARFFSLVAEKIAATFHSSVVNKDSRNLDFVSDIQQMWKLLKEAGARQLGSQHSSDRMDTDEEPPKTLVERLMDKAQRSDNFGDDPLLCTEKKWSVGCSLFASTLHLHLLSCGHDDENPEEDGSDSDEEDDVEEILDSIAEVYRVHELFAGDSSESESPLKDLAELCVNILSSTLGNDIQKQSRGGSPKLLREVVRNAWVAGLSLAAHKLKDPIDPGLLDLLLEAIGAESGLVEDEEDKIDDESEEESSAESGDEAVFTKATNVADVHDADPDKNTDEVESHAEERREGTLELEPGRLQSMLEEESDADIDEGELQHHAGADAALAKLIQVKQDTRKTRQKELERAEMARQLRCVLLVETLVVGKEQTWGTLLRVDSLLRMIIPVLRHRLELEKSLEKGTEKGRAGANDGKRVLVEKLSSLLKTKILKAKVPGDRWTASLNVEEFASDLGSKLFREARKNGSKEHQSLCSSGLIMVLRQIPETDRKLKIAKLYTEAVSEWATKKTTRIEASFFEALIHQYAVIAQACLVPALATSATSARSTFLKSESFRLLSLLYNPKLNSNSSDLEKKALQQMNEASDRVLESVETALKDDQMSKAKRIREVLKTTEKVISFQTMSGRIGTVDSTRLCEIRKLLEQLKSNNESQAVKTISENLLKLIDRDSASVSNFVGPEGDEEVAEAASASASVNLNKRSKKKNKKKKRSKN
jgi:hypothetical protein